MGIRTFELFMKGIFFIFVSFVFAFFLQSCSWITHFHVANRSDRNIVVTYSYSPHKNLANQEFSCRFKEFTVCKEGEDVKAACRDLNPDEYDYDKERCTIKLALATGDVIKIHSACCSYTGPEHSPELSLLGPLTIETPGGSIRYEGKELLKAFEKVDKTLYVLYYR